MMILGWLDHLVEKNLMAINTHFRIWLRHNDILGDPAEIAEIKEQYKLRNEADDWSSSREDNEEKRALDMPILLERGYKAKRDFSLDEKNPREAYGREDGKLYSFLYEIWFGVWLENLRKHYNLDPYKRSEATAFIPLEDVPKIVQASRYLLSGDYSDKLESLLSNEFIKILGDGYPKWEWRKSKRDDIYIDKTDEGRYVVSFGDCQSDAETEEENLSSETMLKKLECCMQNVLEIETDWDGKESIVLEICAF